MTMTPEQIKTKHSEQLDHQAGQYLAEDGLWGPSACLGSQTHTPHTSCWWQPSSRPWQPYATLDYSHHMGKQFAAPHTHSKKNLRSCLRPVSQEPIHLFILNPPMPCWLDNPPRGVMATRATLQVPSPPGPSNLFWRVSHPTNQCTDSWLTPNIHSYLLLQ